jgi:predicted phage tail protein
MLALAGTNPRSARAAGGIRVAALQVVAALLEEEELAVQLAPWSIEILQLCLRALRSIGNGEPAYRVAAVQTACGAAVASRHAWLRIRPITGKAILVLPGAMEDKAIQEAIKVLRQAVTDKFPEVRSSAATLAGILAPMLVIMPPSNASRGVGALGQEGPSPTHWLDAVMQLSLKNLDDESPFCASAWAEGLARCMSTALQYNKQIKADSAGDRDVEKDEDETENAADAAGSIRFGSRRALALPQMCTSLKAALRYLVDHFIKVGGELAASRAGGTFSVGGRAVRVGVGLTITKLLRLESELGLTFADGSISMEEIIPTVLELVGDEMEKHLQMPGSESMGGPASPLFGAVRNRSPSDPGLVRLATSRVIREGLSELASEPVQLAILQDLIDKLPLQEGIARESTEAASKKSPSKKSSEASPSLNANQLQVVLIEISHLLAALGEATASKVEDLLARLNVCLVNEALGVRHEAAIACTALATCFPSEGRKLVKSNLDEMQGHHAQLVKLASMKDSKGEQSGGLRMFRRQTKEKPVDLSLRHQHAIHGIALMVSMLIRELPRLPGGLPTSLLQSVIPAAEILVSCQFDDAMAAASQGGACMCVRAGFGMISGVLSTGPDGAAPHMPFIFGAWKKSLNSAKVGGKNFAPRHDMFCLDAVLSSVVTFLKYCSELLLSIPEALTQTSIMLEETLILFLPKGRIGSIELTPPVTARLESATASLLEAFAWLPSGSFPMAADEMFAFAARHIRDAVDNEVTCSVLHTLVNREDSLLDSKTLSRAKSDGQVGGNRDVEETVISLTMEPAHHSEREAVLHLLEGDQSDKLGGEGGAFRGSHILGAYVSENGGRKPPTPLHEVGTWRMPIEPSCSSKVRLVDGAIQAFSATFGLKSGIEQQSAMDMLESLVPPFLAQLARTIGVNSSLIEQDRRAKVCIVFYLRLLF